MAWELSQEVTNYLTSESRDLTPAERLVLYAIAERASKDGPNARRAWDMDGWNLATITGVSRLRQVLERLSSRGLECRISHNADSRGRPIYAHKGRQTTYQLPMLLVDNLAKGAPASVDNSAKGASVDAPTASVDAPTASVDAPSPSLPVFTRKPPPFPPLAIVSDGNSVEDQNRTDGKVAAAQACVAHLRSRMPVLETKLTNIDFGKLTTATIESLDRGVTEWQITEEVACKSLDGARMPGRVLAARIAALQPQRLAQATERPCPLHRGSSWNACPCCKGDIAAGEDPYVGREYLRPTGWLEHYPHARKVIAA
jgi:hypothetical protein